MHVPSIAKLYLLRDRHKCKSCGCADRLPFKLEKVAAKITLTNLGDRMHNAPASRQRRRCSGHCLGHALASAQAEDSDSSNLLEEMPCRGV